jgi:hypothetical protein
MAGGLSSSFFDQMRCRKSPARNALNSLALFSNAFGDFYCRFYTIEVSGSSRELRSPIDGGHAQMSPSLFFVTE